MKQETLNLFQLDRETDTSEVASIELNFPTDEINPIAKQESWRKEIYRPIYHIHKWWAKRLGSVFRAIIIGAFTHGKDGIWENYYFGIDLKDKMVLDPFMGSGTTLGETVKLGGKAIGCDINPVSKFIVDQSFTRVDEMRLREVYDQLRKDVAQDILQYYTTIDPDSGEEISVLYYFWVKLVTLPDGEKVPLFTRYIFAQNTYPKRNPKAQCVCPKCWSVFEVRYNSTEVKCPGCEYQFNPQVGPAKGASFVDLHGNKYKIKDFIPKDGSPLEHRLYAILAVTPYGRKIYLGVTQYDIDLYDKAAKRLETEDIPLPTMRLRDGHNTKQAIGYNYRKWSDFFNDRQLLGLGLLLKAIMKIEDVPIREQMLCLFSGTLEFNNMFCSFKGEGTGAVRHMFNNHILKPEKTPLENSIWGTNLSSGTFSTLFESRLIPANRYYDNPFEIKITKDMHGRNVTKKLYSRKPIKVNRHRSWDGFLRDEKGILIMQGNSAELRIPSKVVDAVITDPPYFDFIHYSELSDFFYAWLSLALREHYPEFSHDSSSSAGEVQQKDPKIFAQRLALVLKECNRVLKDNGLLIFSFHHSRAEGWAAIAQALVIADFIVTAVHPVYAEFIGSSIKSASDDPISNDIIIVCRKHHHGHSNSSMRNDSLLDRSLNNSPKLSDANTKLLEAASLLHEITLRKLDYEQSLKLLGRIY
ncbi:MAG TPA: DNA methyltransferase [Candidatus Cloacimonadota bacterium]|nr:DNA methyltransferase [Candidatus Cloacimonadota bacterium]